MGVASTSWSTLKSIAADWIRDKKVRVIGQWGLQEASRPEGRAELARSRQDRGRPAGAQAADRPPGVRTALLPAAGRAGGARPGHPPRVRRHHEGPCASWPRCDKAKLEIDPMTGEDVQKLINELFAAPPEVVERVRKILEPPKKSGACAARHQHAAALVERGSRTIIEGSQHLRKNASIVHAGHALWPLRGAGRSAQDDVAPFYAGKPVRILIGPNVGTGYDVTARIARAPHRQPHPRQADRRPAEHAGRRQHDDDQHALQPGPVRRHRDGRLAQRHAGCPDADARGGALRSRQDHLDRLDQHGEPGHLRLARRADQIDRGREDEGVLGRLARRRAHR